MLTFALNWIVNRFADSSYHNAWDLIKINWWPFDGSNLEPLRSSYQLRNKKHSQDTSAALLNSSEVHFGMQSLILTLTFQVKNLKMNAQSTGLSATRTAKAPTGWPNYSIQISFKQAGDGLASPTDFHFFKHNRTTTNISFCLHCFKGDFKCSNRIASERASDWRVSSLQRSDSNFSLKFLRLQLE